MGNLTANGFPSLDDCQPTPLFRRRILIFLIIRHIWPISQAVFKLSYCLINIYTSQILLNSIINIKSTYALIGTMTTFAIILGSNRRMRPKLFVFEVSATCAKVYINSLFTNENGFLPLNTLTSSFAAIV
jgi:hypothetical protein